MSEVKTKGVFDEEGIKNFAITNVDTGETFIALRTGSKFTVGDDGVERTLGECKQLVADDAVVFFADAEKAPEEPRSGTWDCVDPCALLIILAAGGNVCPAEIDRTLNSFGWLRPDGERDALTARENYEKWSKK
jgi:hypothetical protein